MTERAVTFDDALWVLVPREPTEAMIEAYCRAHERLGFRAWANLSTVWPDVLSVAPSPPLPDAGEEDE